MAVIDEYYSSRLDLGPPAAVALLSGFMGERERMNRAIIDQMLAAADPKALAEAERDARKAKNDLLKLKAQVGVEGRKADVGLVKVIAGYEASMRGAESRERVATTAARASIANARYKAEERKQQAIAMGDQAAASAMGIVKNVATATSPDQQVGEYDKAIAAGVTQAGGQRGLTGDAANSARASLAAEAYRTAVAKGHTASAEHIKRTYFGGLEPGVYRERYFAPKTREEMDAEVAQVPLGGIVNSPTFMNILRGEGATNEQVGQLLSGITGESGATGAAMRQVLGDYADDPEVQAAGAQGMAAGLSAATGATQGVPTTDIDAAIADIDRQLAGLAQQRAQGRASLQKVGASRYPNYLYTNPFQVVSRQFDQFARETGAMEPVAAERFVSALAEAPPLFPARFARRELERTEPATVALEGFKTTGGETGGSVLEDLAKRMDAANAILSTPMALGDRGDVVTFTDKGVTIKENTPEGKTVTAPKGSKVYNDLYVQARTKANEGSGLTDLIGALPQEYVNAELGSVRAALVSGGFSAAAKEARGQAAKGGDRMLAGIYADELERIGNIENATEREDAVQALAAAAPEKAEWASAIRAIAEAPVGETGKRAKALARELGIAYRAPEGEVSQAERKAALAGQKAKAEKAEVVDVAREKMLAAEAERLGKSMDEQLGLTPGMGGKMPVTAARPEATIPKTAAAARPDRGASSVVQTPSAEDAAREAYLKAESARLGASMDERLGLVAPTSTSQAPVADAAVQAALARGNLTPRTDAAVDGMVIPSAAAARGYLPAVEQKGAMPMPDIVADSMMPGYTTTSTTPVPQQKPNPAVRRAAEQAAAAAKARKAAVAAATKTPTKAPAKAPAPVVKAAAPPAKAPSKTQAEDDADLLDMGD
jgi:hypothetical protein